MMNNGFFDSVNNSHANLKAIGAKTAFEKKPIHETTNPDGEVSNEHIGAKPYDAPTVLPVDSAYGSSVLSEDMDDEIDDLYDDLVYFRKRQPR